MKLSNIIAILSFCLLNFAILCGSQTKVIYQSAPFTNPDQFQLHSTAPNQLNTIDLNTSSLWYRDSVKQMLKEQHFFMFSDLLASGQTEYQNYAVVKTYSYGKILFMDGEVQSSQADEYIYHESLIHPAMIAHPNPKTVLIIGAGEGASAREALRHPSVEKVVLIDIDGEIIDQCIDWLPEWHEGSFTHPKAQLLIMDGKKYVEETQDTFDIIIIDVCDKLDGSPAVALYTEEFYRSVKKILNPNGIVAIQAMEFDHKNQKDHLFVHRTISKVFSSVASYSVYVDSFWAVWGYVIARDGEGFLRSPEEIDHIIKTRHLEPVLKHYDGITHQHMFSLPKDFRKALKE